jgi:tetratricopeptide (TPR) repeat protein
MPRVLTLLAAALVLAANPANAQADKLTAVEARASRLNDLAERAYALNMADDHAAAEPALREVVEGWRALGWGDTKATHATILLWAWSLIELGRFDEAETELRGLTDASAADGAELTSAWGLLAKMYSRSGRFLDAEPAAAQALAQARQTFGETHAETATAWHNLGTARGEVGRNSDAIAALRRSVALREQLFGATAEPTLVSIYNLAAHLHARGDMDQAEPLLRQVLAHAERGGESHTYALHHLGFTLTRMGRHDEAEPLLRQVAAWRASLSDRHMEAVSLAALADALDGQERNEAADAAYGRAIDLLHANYQSGFAMTLSGVLLGRAETRQAMGRMQAAEDDYRQAVEIARANVPSGHPRLTLRQLGLASFLNDQRRPGEALALLRPARDALLARTRNLGGGEARAEVAPFRSLFRETVQAAWVATQP